ncbi:hypothetical protein ACVW00_002776 [Marmoricola sp. URHA0025 HA25]
MEPSPAVTRRVRGWVRTALLAEAGHGVDPVRGEPVGDEGSLLAATARQRVVELVHDQAAALQLPDGLLDGLAHMRTASRKLVPLQLLELAHVRDLLDAADTPFLAFKGPALAVQTTGDVGARGFGDLDILVDARSVDDVVDHLAAEGWRSSVPLPERDTWAWRRLLHTSNELTFYGASCSVDLHWRLDPTLDGLPPFDVLWGRREVVDLGGVAVSTLSPRDALAHLCLNAARDEWLWLRSLVDISRAARLDGAWDPDHLTGLAVRALLVTDVLVGLPPDVPGWVRDRIARVSPRVRDRTVTAAVRRQETDEHQWGGPGSRFWPYVRYQLAASRTPRDVSRTVSTVILPGWAVRDVPGASAWRGVPVGIGHRTSDLTRRSLSHLGERRGA